MVTVRKVTYQRAKQLIIRVIFGSICNKSTLLRYECGTRTKTIFLLDNSTLELRPETSGVNSKKICWNIPAFKRCDYNVEGRRFGKAAQNGLTLIAARRQRGRILGAHQRQIFQERIQIRISVVALSGKGKLYPHLRKMPSH